MMPTTKKSRRQIIIEFEVGEEDEASEVFDEIEDLLSERHHSIGFLAIVSVPVSEDC